MKSKIYTKQGDKGKTSLVGGTRVSKSHPRLNAYGTIDELNSALGLLAAFGNEDPSALSFFLTRLTEIQHALFNLGSQLACETDKLRARLPQIPESLTAALEADMDSWETELPQLKNFILPGGGKASSQAHVGRTLCRRAERAVVELMENEEVDPLAITFLNRLSDWLFVLARRINLALDIPDVVWKP